MCFPTADHTMILPQQWRLIAPNILQSDCLSSREDNRRIEIRLALFNREIKFDVWSKLARPVIPSRSAKATASSANAVGTDQNTEHSKISTLPFELVLMILESGELSKADIVSLALASPSIRPVVISHVQSSYRKVAAPWAGTPIAILGNYSLDLPPSFMDDMEVLQTYNQWASEQGSTPFWRPYKKAPSRRYFTVGTDFPKPTTPRIEEQAWRDALRKLASRNRHYSNAEFKSVDQQLAYSDLFPRHKKWVLRNLTSKEYYITQALYKKDNSQKRSQSHMRRSRHYEPTPPQMLGFDDVILLRTCWTSIYQQKDLKGKWAGHCFDVITTDVFDDEGREGWTDVSEELVVEAKAHWEHRSTM